MDPPKKRVSGANQPQSSVRSCTKTNSVLNNVKNAVEDETKSVLQDLENYKTYRRNNARKDSSGSSSIDDDSDSGSSSETESDSDNSDDSSEGFGSDVSTLVSSDFDDEDDSDLDSSFASVKGRKSKVSRKIREDSDAPRCPPPPPAAGAKITSSKRKNPAAAAVVVVDEPEDSKYLAQLLRNRKSLNPVAKVDTAETEGSGFALLPKTYDFAKLANQLRGSLTLVTSKFVENPGKFHLEHFNKSYFASAKDHLESAFLYYAEMIRRKKKPVLYSCWMTYSRMEAMRNPVRKKYDDLQWGELTTAAGINVLVRIAKVEAQIATVLAHLDQRQENLTRTIEQKLALMKQFRQVESTIEYRSKKLDEFCHWGKKKLLEAFMSPYFKISAMDFSNLVSPEVFMENVYGNAIICDKKPKWTSKDLQTLKNKIWEVVIEKEYGELQNRFNYLQSMTSFKQSQLESEVESSEGSSSRKESDRPSFRKNRRRGAIEIKEKETSIPLTRSFEVPTSTGNLRISARIDMSTKSLQQWFQQEEAALRSSSLETLLLKNTASADNIDWSKVAAEVVTLSGKERTATDCQLVWHHSMHPAISKKRWTASELKKLKDLVQGGALSWSAISKEFPNRTPYECFIRYQNRFDQGEIMKWDDERDAKLKDLLANEGPLWNKGVELMVDHKATRHQLQERWKKSINPIIRHGAFTRVEDALLLLSIERLRCFVREEGHFGILMHYLPWRYETVWRDRAGSLFSNWIVPWTVEEDKKLMDLAKAQSGKRDWQKIAEQFSSFKNRKGCLTRHKILVSKIGEGVGKFRSVEEYHEAYSMTRYNVFQYRHLREVVELLQRVELTKHPSESFQRLSPDRPPEEWELRWILLDYDRDVVRKARLSIEDYMNARDSYWKDWNEENGSIRKTFDRRTFHRDDPKSVASAIHCRNLEVIPEEDVCVPLTPFHIQVYQYYARFSRTKPLKKDADRPYIPSAAELRKLPEIQDILRQNLDEETSDLCDSDSGEIFDRTRHRKRMRRQCRLSVASSSRKSSEAVKPQRKWGSKSEESNRRSTRRKVLRQWK